VPVPVFVSDQCRRQYRHRFGGGLAEGDIGVVGDIALQAGVVADRMPETVVRRCRCWRGERRCRTVLGERTSPETLPPK